MLGSTSQQLQLQLNGWLSFAAAVILQPMAKPIINAKGKILRVFHWANLWMQRDSNAVKQPTSVFQVIVGVA